MSLAILGSDADIIHIVEQAWISKPLFPYCKTCGWDSTGQGRAESYWLKHCMSVDLTWDILKLTWNKKIAVAILLKTWYSPNQTSHPSTIKSFRPKKPSTLTASLVVCMQEWMDDWWKIEWMEKWNNYVSPVFGYYVDGSLAVFIQNSLVFQHEIILYFSQAWSPFHFSSRSLQESGICSVKKWTLCLSGWAVCFKPTTDALQASQKSKLSV